MYQDVPKTDELAPLIFWILIGHFRANKENFKTLGLFRRTPGHSAMRRLELHMQAGNFGYLKILGSSEISNVMVSNMIKRTLSNMKEPLIPYEFYDSFMKLDE